MSAIVRRCCYVRYKWIEKEQIAVLECVRNVCDERVQVQSIRSTRFRLNDKTINDYENTQQCSVEPW